MPLTGISKIDIVNVLTEQKKLLPEAFSLFPQLYTHERFNDKVSYYNASLLHFSICIILHTECSKLSFDKTYILKHFSFHISL